MLRKLKSCIRTAEAFFAGDIDEVNAQNWSRMRVLVWIYLAALFLFFRLIAIPKGNALLTDATHAALLMHTVFAVIVSVVKKPPKGRYGSALPILLFGLMIMGLATLFDAVIMPESYALVFPSFLIMMALYYTLVPEVAIVLLAVCPAVFLAIEYRTAPYDIFATDALRIVTVFLIAVTSYISTVTVRVRLWQQRRELKKIGAVDALSGAMTRKAFVTAFEEFLMTKPASFGLVIVDIDRFKQINDTYGHMAGDAILRDLCEHGRYYFGEQLEPALIGRFGGDEFLMLVEEPGEPRLLHERFSAAARDIADRAEERGMPPYSVSMGLGVFCGGGWRIDEALRVADKQLYCAKANGGSRCEYAVAEREPAELAEAAE